LAFGYLSSGFVGVNNIKANDYMNAVVQSLAHVRDLRNFLLLEQLSDKTELGEMAQITAQAKVPRLNVGSIQFSALECF
jgi:ubiquitin C-terminal hydrolase